MKEVSQIPNKLGILGGFYIKLTLPEPKQISTLDISNPISTQFGISVELFLLVRRDKRIWL